MYEQIFISALIVQIIAFALRPWRQEEVLVAKTAWRPSDALLRPCGLLHAKGDNRYPSGFT